MGQFLLQYIDDSDDTTTFLVCKTCCTHIALLEVDFRESLLMGGLQKEYRVKDL